MVFRVNGIDFLPYVAFKGLKWTRSDIDGPDAGRNMAGTMLRQRVATKIRLDVTCRPLTSAEAHIVLSTIKAEYVTVQYTDPEAGATVTKTMYANNNPASFLIRKRNGEEYWSNITFPLVEQ